MADRLDEDCRSIDGGREFRWAVGAVTFHLMTFVSFAALKSILLISGLIAESAITRALAVIALVVASIAEELSADRVVAAASDTEMVLFDASPGFARARPTAVLQRITFDSVQLQSTGLLSDRWKLDGRDVRIGCKHRSTIKQWVSEQPVLSVTTR